MFCSNKPGLVKACRAIPGISDHDIVVADCDVKAKIIPKAPRSIFQWSKAKIDEVKKIHSGILRKLYDNPFKQECSRKL